MPPATDGRWLAAPSTIASKIYDQRFIATAPVVDWAPFLDAEGGAPVAGPFLDRPIASTTALAVGTDYLVTSKIAVGAGVTLTIPEAHYPDA